MLIFLRLNRVKSSTKKIVKIENFIKINKDTYQSGWETLTAAVLDVTEHLRRKAATCLIASRTGL